MYCAYRCNEAMCELLINNGADMEVADQAGNTVLLRTVRQGSSSETVSLLLRHGADVNARNHRGDDALNCAALGENVGLGLLYMML
jgi:ankyrin repeat protein